MVSSLWVALEGEHMTEHATGVEPMRKLIVNAAMSMDGFTAAPGDDVSFHVEHALHEQARAQFEGVWRGASTVLLGRTNYEGFLEYWPQKAQDPDSVARDRDFAAWLDTVEKIVFSRSLQVAAWSNARIATQDLESEVLDVKRAPGRDILVLASASIIQALLNADLVDELHISVVPSVLGSGLRLFSEGRPRSTWTLVGSTTTPTTGGVGLRYSRQR